MIESFTNVTNTGNLSPVLESIVLAETFVSPNPSTASGPIRFQRSPLWTYNCLVEDFNHNAPRDGVG